MTEIEEEAAAESDPWVVHVIGPDDVLPATGMLDAIRQAHAINEESVGPEGYYGRADADREFMTLAWAVPSRESWLSSASPVVGSTPEGQKDA